MSLTAAQLAQFKRYFDLLSEWNNKFNITAITDPVSIIRYHFLDSVYLGKKVDMSAIKLVCDVGSGGGFPGLPLAITYPHLQVVLVEVSHKKVEFLQAVIDDLGLQNVTICDCDWRTFLRKTVFASDFILVRASLQPEEMLRMFKPSSPYKDATLIYWASEQWQPSDEVAPHVIKQEFYQVGNRKRKLVFLNRVV